MLTKTLKPIAILLSLIFIISSIILYMIIVRFYDNEAFKRIEQTIQLQKAIHTYVSNYQKPAVYELQDKGIVSPEYFDSRLLSSTFISQKVFESYKSDINSSDRITFKIVSDNPTNPRNLVDDYEAKILQKFRKEELETYKEFIKQDNNAYVFYAENVGKNKAKCMQCHGDPKDAPAQMIEKFGDINGFYEKLGDTRAIVALYVPLGHDDEQFYVVLLSLLSLSFSVFLSIFLIIAYYAKKVIEKDKLIAKQSKFVAMGEMIGMIAHQWRQPLTGMGMTVDNLKLDIELETIDEKQWTKSLDLIKTQIHYLSHTIDDFRNFFKPEQSPQEVELSAFLDEVLQITEANLKQNGVKVYKFYDENTKVKTFRNDLMQVILNLIKNSSDAMQDKGIKDGEIKIAYSVDKGWIEIEVSDNAGGIPDEIIDKVFDPYFSTKDEKNGTGLGLYMSKMIIEDHLQGSLDLITDTQGSSFIIKIKDKVQENGN